jgi:uncharacterized protein
MEAPLRSLVRWHTLRIYSVRYEWEEKKNRHNRSKHSGISFELAASVFEDEHCLIGPDRIDESGERRWHAVGMAQIESEAAVLLVVHVNREDRNDEEIIRIISARRATKREIRRYQEQEMD